MPPVQALFRRTMQLPRSAQPSVTSAPSVDELLDRLWIALTYRRGETIPREQLRELVSIVSREARRCGMLPEQLVVAVKDSWKRHPKLRDAYSRHEALGTLADVVALCISEFFRTDEQA